MMYRVNVIGANGTPDSPGINSRVRAHIFGVVGGTEEMSSNVLYTAQLLSSLLMTLRAGRHYKPMRRAAVMDNKNARELP